MFDTSTTSSGDVPEQGEELEPLQGATAEDQPESADADGAEFDESAAEDRREENTHTSDNTSSISPTFFLAGVLGDTENLVEISPGHPGLSSTPGGAYLLPSWCRTDRD